MAGCHTSARTTARMRGISDAFAAIDFETADYDRASACAVGVKQVESGRIVHRARYVILPPTRFFTLSYLHGITWSMVERKPAFRELWAQLKTALDGVDFVAAHMASFDRSVLEACCLASRIRPPAVDLVCTMRLARRACSVRPTTLPDVCRYPRAALRHHDRLTDAGACGKIVPAARAEGQGDFSAIRI